MAEDMTMAKDLVSKAKQQAGDGACPQDVWKVLHQSLLSPDIPFQVHEQCYQLLYGNDANVKPAWIPTLNGETNIEQAMKKGGFEMYQDFYEWSVAPETRNDFWMESQEAIGVKWHVPPAAAFELKDNSAAHVSYFPRGKLNITDSVFHDKDNSTAIVYAQESAPKNVDKLSLQDLELLTNRVANAIQQKLCLKPGDAVGICMPMTPQAVAVYLGIVRAGCVVVSIADSFSAQEIATRCKLAKAKAIFTQDVIYRGASGKVLPLYGRVLEADVLLVEQDCSDENKETKSDSGESESMNIIVLPANSQDLHESVSLRMDFDSTFAELLERCSDEFVSVKRDAMDACNILFSSGTTGEPKAIVWSHSTPIKCAIDGYYHQNVQVGDKCCWPSNIGWMMGPWLIFQLINGATIGLFNGVTSTAPFCEYIEAAEISMLGVIPSLVKAWQAGGATDHCDWSCITRFSSTGEASDPTNYLWLMSRVPGYAPVMEYCGGTEIGGSFLSSTMVQPNTPSMFASPVLGSKLLLQDSAGKAMSTTTFQPGSEMSQSGEICLVPPALGLSTKLLNRNHFDTYYNGMGVGPNDEVLRRHGDEIEFVRCSRHLGGRDNVVCSPYYRALGRCDDTMNIGGIKVSSVEIERVCNMLEGVQETAAIAVGSGANGCGPSKLVIYAVVKTDGVDAQSLKKALQMSIKTKLNPLFGISDVVVTEKLPRTASNKVMRRLLRDDYVKSVAE